MKSAEKHRSDTAKSSLVRPSAKMFWVNLGQAASVTVDRIENRAQYIVSRLPNLVISYNVSPTSIAKGTPSFRVSLDLPLRICESINWKRKLLFKIWENSRFEKNHFLFERFEKNNISFAPKKIISFPFILCFSSSWGIRIYAGSDFDFFLESFVEADFILPADEQSRR